MEAAFLNSNLREDLFIKYPGGVVELGLETHETTLNFWCILLYKGILKEKKFINVLFTYHSLRGGLFVNFQ